MAPSGIWKTHIKHLEILNWKMAILNAEIAKLKAEVVGKKNSGPTELVKPKVFASMMYTKSSKFFTKTRTKNTSATAIRTYSSFGDRFQKNQNCHVARKPNPKNNFRNHSRLPTKSVKARRAADFLRNLCACGSPLKMLGKLPRKTLRDENCTQWKPTGKRFQLCDNLCTKIVYVEPIVTPSKFTPCVSPRTNVTLSMEPVLKPLELTPCVSSSSSSTVTMVSRSVGRTVADSSTKRLKRATTYVFRWFDLSLLSRIRTLVIDSPCSKIKTRVGLLLEQTGYLVKEISNPFIVQDMRLSDKVQRLGGIEEKIISNSRKICDQDEVSNLVIQVLNRLNFTEAHLQE
ncbi:hypothetical protein Tco_0997175, partial [Tanacetum coccineum]